MGDPVDSIARARRLLRWFDRQSRRCPAALTGHFDAETARAVCAEAREEYIALIPEIPYVGGGENPMATYVPSGYWGLAYYRPLTRRGHTIAQIGPALADASIPLLAWAPGWLGRWLIRLALPLMKWRFKRGAALSQQRRYAGDFVFAYYEGDDCDFGMDIQECAVCIACARHDAMELVPYLCAGDDTMSAALDLGLRRTGTRALGADRCDFRFTVGGAPLTLQSQYPDLQSR